MRETHVEFYRAYFEGSARRAAERGMKRLAKKGWIPVSSVMTRSSVRRGPRWVMMVRYQKAH